MSPSRSITSPSNYKNDFIQLIGHPKIYSNALKFSNPRLLNSMDLKTNFDVPVFVLHAKGCFYVPLTIDYKTLLPYLQNYNIMEVLPNVQNIVLHPVTINVNFQPHFNTKTVNYRPENSW